MQIGANITTIIINNMAAVVNAGE